MKPFSSLDPLLVRVVENSSDFFGIASDSGQALYVNGSGRIIFGLQPEQDISNLTMFDFIHSENHQVFRDKVMAKSIRGEKVKKVLRVKSFSNQEVFNMDFDFFYIPEKNQNPAMFMAFGKDLRKSELNLNRLRILEAVIENTSDFVGVADNNFKPIYINPAGRKLLGISDDISTENIPIKECYPEELQDFAVNTILKEMMEKGRWSGETYFKHFVTNQKIPVHDTHFVIKNPETQKPLGHATITRDMTREKELSEKLDSEKAKIHQASKLSNLGEMAAGVAHEINNPIAVIDGALSILVKSTNDPHVLKKLDMIRRSSDRISRIVNGLKKFSRASNTINKSVFSASGLIEECVELTSARAKEFGVHVLSQVPIDLLIYADELLIEQIIINLINNAIDENASKTNAWIKLSAVEVSGFVQIMVQDSGSGISKEIEEKLFHPFYTTKPVGKGTGLGLSIAKGIAVDHGGDLFYEKVNGHTAFILKIPMRMK